MSYRSEVALVLAKSGLAKLFIQLGNTQISREIRSNAISIFEQADYHCFNETTESEFWYWQNTGWNPDTNNAVAFIEAFIHQLPQDDYYFIRISEDLNNNVFLGAFCDNPFEVAFYRQIKFQKH